MPQNLFTLRGFCTKARAERMSARRRYAPAKRNKLPPLAVILRNSAPGWLDPSPEHLAAARAFLLDKWRERARERGRPEPIDLTDACKFASAFAQAVFGGRLRGNWHHQWVEHPRAGRIDLTDAARVEGHSARCVETCSLGELDQHDPFFWGNSDHRDSVESTLPRVQKWLAEFELLMDHRP